MVEPFLSAGVGGGSMQIVGWPYNTVQKNVPVAQYVATKSYIDANPAIIERFNASVVRRTCTRCGAVLPVPEGAA